MSGYVVHDHAAALDKDWYKTWPQPVAAKPRPGGYVLLDEMVSDARVTEWREHDAEQP